jgi:hypothetical protein
VGRYHAFLSVSVRSGTYCHSASVRLRRYIALMPWIARRDARYVLSQDTCDGRAASRSAHSGMCQRELVEAGRCLTCPQEGRERAERRCHAGHKGATLPGGAARSIPSSSSASGARSSMRRCTRTTTRQLLKRRAAWHASSTSTKRGAAAPVIGYQRMALVFAAAQAGKQRRMLLYRPDTPAPTSQWGTPKSNQVWTLGGGDLIHGWSIRGTA